jgi:hypothetical protein
MGLKGLANLVYGIEGFGELNLWDWRVWRIEFVGLKGLANWIYGIEWFGELNLWNLSVWRTEFQAFYFPKRIVFMYLVHIGCTRRFYRALTMVCNTQNQWVSGLCPSSGILKIRNRKDSKTGFVSPLRWEGSPTVTYYYISMLNVLIYKACHQHKNRWNCGTVLTILLPLRYRVLPKIFCKNMLLGLLFSSRVRK